MKASSLYKLAAATAALTLCGCELTRTAAEVTLKLPSLPAWITALSAEAAYEIEWLDEAGALQRRNVAPGNRGSSVRLPKLSNTAVVAYPIIPATDGSKRYRLLPGGALFPHHRSGSGRLNLSWDAGAVAHAMLRIAVVTGHPEHYNAVRLHRELLARTEGDPWSVDLDALIDQLLAGGFRATSIRPAERFALEVPAPTGIWYPENLLRAPLETVLTQQHAQLRLELEPGLHRLFHSSGRWVLNLMVDSAGTARWTLIQHG
ncbi:MAG: hypothetical protein EA384_08135 [Spirochaetaceae bacterium]|nr:MAG: hypothetical protein EA384_08135 [Spirochaetaceae bacterium]